jgi:indolepyruvate ferredoxin oxidoreductase
MGAVAPSQPGFSLNDRYTREDGDVLLSGVQALVRLVLDQRRADRRAGARTAALVSGYQGSPLAGLDIELGRQRALLEQHDVVHQPAVNEELAATAIFGTQIVDSVGGARYDGVLGLWYGKAPGLDRAADAIRHANLMGTASRGGVLAVVGDDPQSKSSTIPSSSDANFFDLQLPTLVPADAQEVLDLGRHGYALSRATGVWVGMKVATNVADGVFTARVGPEREPTMIHQRPFELTPQATMLAPLTLELERMLHEVRLPRARAYAAEHGLNRVTRAGPGDRVGVLATGKTYLDLVQALRSLGLDDGALEAMGVRLMKLSMPYPLDPDAVRTFANALREIIVVEEKRGLLELFVKEALHGMTGAPRVLGKQDERGAPLVRAHGELDGDAIALALGPRMAALEGAPPGVAERVQQLAQVRVPVALPLARTPYFCSGCPHNTSTKVPAGAAVGGGIGCHGMVMMMEPSQVGDVVGVTQMGGEGAQWIGMAPFTEHRHFIQNMGDGTFAHSGSLAVRAAVAADAHVTFKILCNSAVAMTGGQQLVGGIGTAALTRLLEVEGVRRTIVTSDDPNRLRGETLAANAEVWPRARLIEAQERLATVAGVTALVHDQECAVEKRRRRKRGQLAEPRIRAFINERVCEGCGDCGAKSNCLSVHPVDTELGRKTRIHQASCNRDFTCLEGDCPSFLTVIPAKRASAGASADATGFRRLGTDAVADPPRPDGAGSTSVRIVGIGGTGVVTVSQLLATAALIDGFAVRGLDQTGLAQKGGPVVSDLQIAPEPFEAGNKLAAGSCDLLIACDLLVAAEPRNLAVMNPERTLAVVSLAETPTGHQVIDPTVVAPPVAGLVERIAAAALPDALVRVDATEVTGTLLGSDQTANTLLLGAAYQSGRLPMSGQSIEAAIRLNGVAVDDNLEAFRRGRQLVADPEALERHLEAARPAPPDQPPPSGDERAIADIVRARPGSELRRLVDIRVPDLVRYQNAAYARRYAEVVERMRAAEARATPEADDSLTEEVARGLHKLMAYKDEYEVARLHLDPALRASVEAEFGPGARYAWRLHPPLLRALGMRRKLTLGRWFTPAFRVLRAARGLRGTPFDPFGHARVRKVERELLREYRAVLERIAEELDPANHATAVRIAGLPELVRGYEEIKLAGVDRYRAKLAELLRQWEPEGAA